MMIQPHEIIDEAPYDDPPEDWWPDESTPSWVEDPHGEEVWVVEWTT